MALLDVKDELEILLQLLNQQEEVMSDLKAAYPLIQKYEHHGGHARQHHNTTEYPLLESATKRILQYTREVKRLDTICKSATEVVSILHFVFPSNHRSLIVTSTKTSTI